MSTTSRNSASRRTWLSMSSDRAVGVRRRSGSGPRAPGRRCRSPASTKWPDTPHSAKPSRIATLKPPMPRMSGRGAGWKFRQPIRPSSISGAPQALPEQEREHQVDVGQLAALDPGVELVVGGHLDAVQLGGPVQALGVGRAAGRRAGPPRPPPPRRGAAGAPARSRPSACAFPSGSPSCSGQPPRRAAGYGAPMASHE